MGVFIDEERRGATARKVDMLYTDRMKAHGWDREKNKINVVLRKALETGKKSLLGLTVNRR